MFASRQDKNFAIGMICAVVTLYSVSMYSYFSKKTSDTSSTPHVAEVITAENRAEGLLRVMNSDDQVLFSPIGGAEAVAVPGSSCVITSQNLDLSNTFRNIPEECFPTSVLTSQGE